MKTNPVHPSLRKAVVKSMSSNTNVALEPSSTDRPGVIKLKDGLIHTLTHFEEFEVTGVSSADNSTRIHVEKA